MATEYSQKFTATLSNNYNSNAYAYQGGYSSSASTGSTVTSRKGYFAFSGLSALVGKAITKIEWYLSYTSSGKEDVKTLTFTSPSASFSSSVVAYGKTETRTLASSSDAFYSAIVSAIKGTGSVTFTMYNGETSCTHSVSDGGAYTENYLCVNSSYITVYYTEETLPFSYYNGSSWVDVEAAYYYNGSSWVTITGVGYYNGSAWVDVK